MPRRIAFRVPRISLRDRSPACPDFVRIPDICPRSGRNPDSDRARSLRSNGSQLQPFLHPKPGPDFPYSRQRYHGAAIGTEAMRLPILCMAGWINSRQLEVTDFLREENRVPRKQLGERRRFTDDQGATPGRQGTDPGSSRLGGFAGLITPDLILRE